MTDTRRHAPVGLASRRYGRFVTVGAGGFVVQLAALAALTAWTSLPYPFSVAIAVELAILHNFVLHDTWTWRDRVRREPGGRVGAARRAWGVVLGRVQRWAPHPAMPDDGMDRLAAEETRKTRFLRLLRFNAITALVSIAGNVSLTAVGVQWLGLAPIVANVVAVAVLSTITFVAADRWVFRALRPSADGRPRAEPPPARGRPRAPGWQRWRPGTRVVCAAVLLGGVPSTVWAGPSDAALSAWSRYVRQVSRRIGQETASTAGFFTIDAAGTGRGAALRAALRTGTIVAEDAKSAEGTTAALDVPGGTIQHWRGYVFVRSVTLDDVLAAVADPTGPHAARPDDVLDARVLRRAPGELAMCLKIRRRVALVTAGYDTEHEVRYGRLGPARASSHSVATRIVELENAGEPGERERAAGDDRGFLWRLESFWRYEAVAGGVMIELESLSLSRDVPWGVRTVAAPIVNRLARDAMVRTLAATRDGLLRGR